MSDWDTLLVRHTRFGQSGMSIRRQHCQARRNLVLQRSTSATYASYICVVEFIGAPCTHLAAIAYRTMRIDSAWQDIGESKVVTTATASAKGFRSACFITAVLVLLTGPLTTLAALGGDLASVQTDQARLKATLRPVMQNGKYAVHELQVPSGTVIRQYASPDGSVFGIAWRGPMLPDLKQLLGTYFDQYAAANVKHTGHRSIRIHQGGLVFESSGHMRAFVGRAYVPQLVPPGVAIEEIR